MNSDFWDERYSTADFVYGTAPNDFVAAVAHHIPGGPVLCLAEGEGRNAVYLAQCGHEVLAVDASATGLHKAEALAAAREVSIQTQVVDLADYAIAPGGWAGIVATWAHLPPDLRRRVHAQVVQGLVPGGVYILEAYTPNQLRFDTGGPKDPQLLMTLSALREELTGLDLIIGRELEREVVEGRGHTGRAAVVQVLARRRGEGAPE
jgi:SAM-dependent methyltransferase